MLATIHGLHRNNPAYTYDDVYRLVDAYRPDFIGVEIRPEDLAAPADYLAANYPAEMIHFAEQGGPRVFGFDWLGDDVAGAPIPSDWWASRSPIKRLERQLDQDPRYRDARLQALQARQAEIARSASAAGLNDGRYDRLNDLVYARQRADLAHSPYAGVAQFYAERDRRIAANIAARIRASPGARFVVLTGADHRSALIRSLRRTFGRAVRISPVPAAA